MSTKSKSSRTLSVVDRVAGEDLAPGDYVARFTTTVHVPSYFWDCCHSDLTPEEMVQLQFIPWDAGEPLKVLNLCLPFVYAAAPDRRLETIDVRRTRLVRLDSCCARQIWKTLRKQAKRNTK